MKISTTSLLQHTFKHKGLEKYLPDRQRHNFVTEETLDKQPQEQDQRLLKTAKKIKEKENANARK